jgi:hypothetical protein
MGFPAVFTKVSQIKPAVYRLAWENYNDFVKNGPIDLFKSKVIYHREDNGFNFYLSAREVEAAGYGDCEDLSAWLLALLWLDRIYAVPAILKQRNNLYHIAVYAFFDGEWLLLDPSVWKGM